MNFEIYAKNFHWISDDGNDDPKDYCLHGDAFAEIGGEKLEYHSCVSAAGLYLLRTLTEDHIIHTEEHIFPCCGHYFFPVNKELDTVDISGCTQGLDFSVIHEGDKVKIVTEAGNEYFVDFEEYVNKVYAFADSVEAYYGKCLPKVFEENTSFGDFDRDAYTAFWNEWKRHRNKKEEKNE